MLGASCVGRLKWWAMMSHDEHGELMVCMFDSTKAPRIWFTDIHWWFPTSSMKKPFRESQHDAELTIATLRKVIRDVEPWHLCGCIINVHCLQWIPMDAFGDANTIRSYQVLSGPRSQVPQILGPFSSRNSNPILIFIQFTHIMVILGGTQYLDRSRHRWYSLIIHCSNQHQLPRPPRPSPAPQSAALALQSAPYSWHPAGLSSVGNRPVMSIVLECDGFHLCIVCDPLVEISYVYIYVYTYMYMYMFIYIYSAAGCWMFLDILSRLSESTLAHFPSLTLPRVW